MNRLCLFILFFLLAASAVSFASAADASAPAKSSTNPFTEKAALLRYWTRKIPNASPHPPFLVSKLTPLSASAAAKFSAIAASDPFKLSSSLPPFCSAAALFCNAELAPSLTSHPGDSAFSGYDNGNFSNYGTKAAGGLTSFQNYTDEFPFNTFRRYAHDSDAHDDSFSIYGHNNNNDVQANFTSYGTNSAEGLDKFNSYSNSTNSPDLAFTNYATDSTGRAEGFSHYADDSNVGQQTFSSYGKRGKGVISGFTSYAHKFANIIASGFAHYGENGHGDRDTFTSYAEHSNIPDNHFQSYGTGGTGEIDKFTTYRHQSNIGDDSFVSYEKGAKNGGVEFTNYGNDSSGADSFKVYGEDTGNNHVTFKSYFEDNTTFKAYAKTGIDFKSYKNSSSARASSPVNHAPEMNRWVEAGKFFRESSMKEGTVMPMPDIRNRMPPRSFLPRTIAGKIPFSSAAVNEIFKFPTGSAMEKAVGSTVGDCERAPSRGETKRCVTSAEDMIDFAVSVLGSDVEVRSTANTNGSKENILIGEVKGVDGGKVTESVSCHQSLFPYLVYYCHSVPRVRVYEAEILSVDSKEKINHGVAICHIDTSDWSAGHGAFVALGPGPGKIEVCHWIFEGDMTWTVGDRA